MADATNAIRRATNTSYRRDIDGLRAIAVLPVVLFHAGVPGLSGGFVGVDVFFVISGYLITGILVGEAQQGRLSIGRFYERRVRRIAPALLVMLFFSAAAAHLTLFPSQYVSFGQSLIASELFASNIWFFKETGYFQATGSVRPLLHTWSLAVEEQFYLGMPLFIALMASKPKALRVTILSLAGLSFLISCAGVLLSPPATFYLIPTRAWELLIGSILAMSIVPSPTSRLWAEVHGVAGVFLILISVMLLNEGSYFPGPLALPSCVGAAAIIQASRTRDTITARVLSWRPLVGVGLISYSLYLWHWPIIAFARQFVGDEFTTVQRAACVFVSFIAGALSWRFVESPTRNRQLVNVRALLIGTGAVSTVLAVWAVLAIWQRGFPARFSPEVRLLAAGANDKMDVSVRCGWATVNAGCHLGNPADTSFLFAGDSFAGALAPAISQAAGEKGGAYNSFNSCPALLGWKADLRARRARRACTARNQMLFDQFKRDPEIRTLIIANSWAPLIRREPREVRATLAQTAALAQSLGKRLIVLHGLPEPDFDVPWGLAVDRARGRPPRWIPAPPSDIAALGLDRLPGVAHIDLSRALCTGSRCRLTVEGRPLFFDGGHVSITADEKLIGPYLARSGIFGGQLSK